MRPVALILFALGVLLVGLVPAATAGNCSTPAFVQTPVVQTPVVVTTPVAVVATPVIVTQFVQVPLFAVGYDPTTYGVTEELKAIREELRQTREQNKPTPQVLPTQPPQQAPQATPPVDPMAPLPQAAPVAVGPLAVLQTHCAACHTGAKSKGGVVIFDAPGQLAADVNRFDLYEIVAAGKMPPAPKPKVAPSDVTALRQWVRETASAKGK